MPRDVNTLQIIIHHEFIESTVNLNKKRRLGKKMFMPLKVLLYFRDVLITLKVITFFSDLHIFR